ANPRRSPPQPPQAGPGRVKRRKTRGERNRAKFGPSLRGARWRGGRHPWIGLPQPRATQLPPSPLPPPRPVIITQQRLCRPRGLLGRGVASMDIKRLLEGGQGAQTPPRLPAEELTGPPESPRPVKGMEKEGDSFSAVTSARGLAARLCALLPQPAEFWGRVLAEERRRALLAVLLEHHHTLPDLATLIPHKSVGAAGGLSHAQPPVLPPASQPPPGLKDEDDAHPENPAPQFWVQTPPPPFRSTPAAHSPISHPRVRHCTPEPELPPQPRPRRDPALHYCRCRAPLQAVAQVSDPKNCFSQKTFALNHPPLCPCCQLHFPSLRLQAPQLSCHPLFSVHRGGRGR
uniref:Uncharacterized protein n=1 Tax=Phasianus colchicus TaxID=9054 RepID=A0A669Q779_PHACC